MGLDPWFQGDEGGRSALSPAAIWRGWNQDLGPGCNPRAGWGCRSLDQLSDGNLALMEGKPRSRVPRRRGRSLSASNDLEAPEAGPQCRGRDVLGFWDACRCTDGSAGDGPGLTEGRELVGS